MNTSCTFAAVSLALATATGAMAASPNADNSSTPPDLQPLTRDAVIADLVVSRQAAPSLTPHDGEWYNAPAPLGQMAPLGQRDSMAGQMRPEDRGSAKAIPTGYTGPGAGSR